MKRLIALTLVLAFIASFAVVVWAAPYRTKYKCHWAYVIQGDGNSAYMCVKGAGAKPCDSCADANN